MVARHERWFSGALVAPQAGGARRGGGAARAQACGRSAGRHCGPAGGPKRGRPDAYYTQAIHLWLAQRSLAKPRFITYHGWWSLGRSFDLSLASPLEPPQESTKP